jgi:hypothetical protein
MAATTVTASASGNYSGSNYYDSGGSEVVDGEVK